jgi:putative oxidoreductase
MKKLMSINYSSFAFNVSMLIMRLVFGGMMIRHGFTKLTKFNEVAPTFIDPFHIGTKASLALVVFAEFFCALFLVIGLFTRGALVALVICMAVAVFIYHKGQSLDESEAAVLYLGAYAAMILLGPGKFSVDGLVK